MCGIAGYWSSSTKADARAALPRMCDAIIHRGPDSSGYWNDDVSGIHFGHRRLSIIDLSEKGHQPMQSASGRYVIIYNGEMYNAPAIRTRLEQGGQPAWQGHSDTEVFLAAIEAWGFERALESFTGMFAFAIWDREKRALYLARDRAGEKPLYYGWQNGHFLFGSELAALKAHPACDRIIDTEALGLYFRKGYVPAPYSIYQGIRKLLPGHVLVLSAAELTAQALPQPRAYWSLGGTQVDVTDDPQAALEELLRTSVREQLLSDVPVGAFLSGGVDSSLIVALLQAQSSRPINTYTLGFDDARVDESEHARAVARHLGTNHTEHRVTEADALNLIPDLPRIYSEPFADSSQIPTTLVSRMARRYVTVALSGDGGDELFGGYNRYLTAESLWRKLALLPAGLRKPLGRMLTHVPPGAWDLAGRVFQPLFFGGQRFSGFGDKVHKVASSLAAPTREALYDGVSSFWDAAEIVKDYRAGETRMRSLAPGEDFAAWMMEQDFLTYLPDDIMTKVDRAAMSTSLETRAPFLNRHVIEFAHALPIEQKIRGRTSKWLLRQILYKYVPRELIERPKQGFGIPLDRWLRGALKDWASDLLDPTKLREQGLLDEKLVGRVWQDHLEGRHNRHSHLWSVLMFQSWMAQP